jgi:hypothetical protein
VLCSAGAALKKSDIFFPSLDKLATIAQRVVTPLFNKVVIKISKTGGKKTDC